MSEIRSIDETALTCANILVAILRPEFPLPDLADAHALIYGTVRMAIAAASQNHFQGNLKATPCNKGIQ